MIDYKEKYIKYKNKYLMLKGGKVNNFYIDNLKIEIINKLKLIGPFTDLNISTVIKNIIIKKSIDVDINKIDDNEYIKTLSYYKILKDFYKGTQLLINKIDNAKKKSENKKLNIIAPGDSPIKPIIYMLIYDKINNYNIFNNINLYCFPLSLQLNNISMIEEFKKYINEKLKLLIDEKKNIREEYLCFINSKENNPNIIDGVDDKDEDEEEDEDEDNYSIGTADDSQALKREIINKYIGNIIFMDVMVEGKTIKFIIDELDFPHDIKRILNDELQDNSFDLSQNPSALLSLVMENDDNNKRLFTKQLNGNSMYNHIINLKYYYDPYGCLQYIMNSENTGTRCIEKKIFMEDENENNEINNFNDFSSIGCEDFIYDAILFYVWNKKKYDFLTRL